MVQLADADQTWESKRNGRWVERGIFLPEEDHVIVPFGQVDARARGRTVPRPGVHGTVHRPVHRLPRGDRLRLWGVKRSLSVARVG